jgi:hypothetical protein
MFCSCSVRFSARATSKKFGSVTLAPGVFWKINSTSTGVHAEVDGLGDEELVCKAGGRDEGGREEGGAFSMSEFDGECVDGD